MALAAFALAGCTTTTQPEYSHRAAVHNKCLELNFVTGTPEFDKCYSALIGSPIGTATPPAYRGAPAMMPPPVTFQPLPMPQRYGTPNIRVQANCTTYQTGMYTNTNCY